MATSRQPISIPANTWVDLYATTTIAVGTQIIIQNIGGDDVRLSESVAEPISTTGYNRCPFTRYVTSAITPVGAWAFSISGCILQIEEA